MKSLSDILLGNANLDALHRELGQLLEQQVKSKSGLSGMAMKAAFAALRARKPDIAERAAKSLLPDFAKALDPIHAEFKRSKASDFGSYLQQHGAPAAQRMTEIIDARISSSPNKAAKAFYQRFKGSLQTETEQLMPALGALLTRHLV